MADFLLLEQQVLSKAEATDFAVSRLIGSGQHGMVVAARCTKGGLPNPKKLYAVKLLFNFTHDYSSVMSNQYENEWLVLSRLLPHPNIVRYWGQFISPIPDEFIVHLPQEMSQSMQDKPRLGKTSRRKGQFIVLDCHQRTLQDFLLQQTTIELDPLLKYSSQILEAVRYLESHQICHLDLKLTNCLVTEESQIVLCDFGSAVQFPDQSLTTQWCHGMTIGGNRAHLCPEIISQYYQCKMGSKSKQQKLCYKGQPAFETGVLLHELITCGEHPLQDYPLNYLKDGLVTYASSDIAMIPNCYPEQLSSLIKSLVNFDPNQRPTVATALKTIRQIQEDIGHGSNGTFLEQDLTKKLASVTQERDFAQSQLATLASERDFALKEMKAMAEQCQTVASEFEKLAKQCDSLKEQLEKVKAERDIAIQASEGSFEAYEFLHKELELVVRERDLARDQVEKLRQICSKVQTNDEIKECTKCQQFYYYEDNTEELCQWHPGKYLFNRWSCCYKTDKNTIGCKKSLHS